MNKLCQIYYIGISDFLDRIRRKSIFISTLLMMYISYLFFPQNNSSFYYTLNYNFEGFFYRGIYNSVWLGWIATIAFISVITLIGFYFVRNSIKRERELLIGEITASMEAKSWIFIFGKTFGNLLFLLLQMVIVIFITIIMQFVRGESYSFEVIKLVTPFFILAVPTCFIIAVIAIIFDIIPILRNSFGNVAYFFAWSGICVASLGESKSYLADVFGMNTTARIILEQFKNNFDEFKDIDSFSLGTNGPLHDNINTFVMDNVNIDITVFIGRLFWIVIGILVLFLIAIFFKRSSLIRTKVSTRIKKGMDIKQKEFNTEKRIVLSKIFENKTYSNNFNIILSELKIMFSTCNLWWYLTMVLCSIGVFFAKGENLYKLLIPIMWISPIFIWSKLGTIQMNFNMENYLVTYKNYRKSQMYNSVIAGILFTIIINISIIIKFILLENFLGVIYILMGIFFVNAFGMFMGNITKNSTAFEIIYIILWYVGMLNDFTSLDFLGLTKIAVSKHIPIMYLVVGIILIIASILIKKNRINTLKI
ncbi:hypothetical protein [Clostridium weizhouense]|uniref:ABC transporter permease n=1 Tax=Clostridium weizhouense TaxID=2859781 RepID=A0ABS7AMG4_9CLOT|nr:hypothetical protein [Clostridium weizhouense]MBW6408690.1 hypothetical protein [Clostridium weizhouense]